MSHKIYQIPYSIKLASVEDREWCRKNIRKLRAFIETRGNDLALRPASKPRPEEEFSKYISKVQHPNELYEWFTCPETRQAAQIGDLPCIEGWLKTNEEFQCKNASCQQTLKRRVGIDG